MNKPCQTSLGFPAVLPHAESDEAAGNFSFHFKEVITTIILQSDESVTLFSSTEWDTNLVFFFLCYSSCKTILSLLEGTVDWCNIDSGVRVGRTYCVHVDSFAVKERTNCKELHGS